MPIIDPSIHLNITSHLKHQYQDDQILVKNLYSNFRWMQGVEDKPGLNAYVLKSLKDSAIKDPYNYANCVLMFDEMSIKQSVMWIPSEQKRWAGIPVWLHHQTGDSCRESNESIWIKTAKWWAAQLRSTKDHWWASPGPYTTRYGHPEWGWQSLFHSCEETVVQVPKHSQIPCR